MPAHTARCNYVHTDSVHFRNWLINYILSPVLGAAFGVTYSLLMVLQIIFLFLQIII